ncbi:DGQHR domain-containing protein [bacterium]|nr:DGQHR domain-containing protein [bacterium]
MNEKLKSQFLDGLISENKLVKAITSRKKLYIYKSILPESQERYESLGWEVDKKFKHVIRMRKHKPFDMIFEDQVWAIFAKIGFTYMNKDRNFHLPYSTSDLSLTQQIDVFAKDSETILIIECKATEGEPKKGNFKEPIEALGARRSGIIKILNKLYPNIKHKVKFIFATRNYVLSAPDIERLKEFKILHFNGEVIDYYSNLTQHLGVSARFQLLGNLFEGQEIPEMQNEIPAIEGKMGGHTYYSFSIEPEKLLKISYVLHRNKANKRFMPTYQRLIKKARLKKVHEFIENEGFFPNSIVINIETKKRALQFDISSLQSKNSLSRIGILHLPRKYRSVFIIDGQHRLYGYANSEYKSKNAIPVVAFVDLKREEQVSLFMQINENQKAVPKNLRNTLNSDLLWDSENLIERIKALKLQIAMDLGEEIASPLFNRIIIGENTKSNTRCITIDTIKVGLDRSNYFGKFTKTAITENGTFYKGNNSESYNVLFPFLQESFRYLKKKLPEDWGQGDLGNGYLTINAGIESLIRVFSDIIDYLVDSISINPKTDTTNKLVEAMIYYLDPLIDYFRNLSSEEKLELRQKYGTGGRAKYWRILQREIHKIRNEFNPTGMLQYWKEQDMNYTDKSFGMIRDIETFLKLDFREKLLALHGDNWFKLGLPKNVYDETIKRAADKNYKVVDSTGECQPWDCLNIIDYRKIATYGRNWISSFEDDYTRPLERKISGGKEAKTKWMQKLEAIRNQNFHSYDVKEDEYEFLCEIIEWLVRSD